MFHSFRNLSLGILRTKSLQEGYQREKILHQSCTFLNFSFCFFFPSLQSLELSGIILKP